MAFTPEEIEYYHNSGLMPDWVYYQTNGKSLQENYNAIKRKQQKETAEHLERRRLAELDRRRKAEEAKAQKKAEQELEKEIETKAEEAIDKALKDLFKDFLK